MSKSSISRFKHRIIASSPPSAAASHITALLSSAMAVKPKAAAYPNTTGSTQELVYDSWPSGLSQPWRKDHPQVIELACDDVDCHPETSFYPSSGLTTQTSP
jgi:hypothetical protein